MNRLKNELGNLPQEVARNLAVMQYYIQDIRGVETGGDRGTPKGISLKVEPGGLCLQSLNWGG